MTASPFNDCVAIDTNVFVHLLNPQRNVNSHINRLLEHLERQNLSLIIDSSRRILGEYKNHILPIILNTDESGNERALLSYWILNARRCEVPIDNSDQLMSAIRQVILEHSKSKDRVFVYAAFKLGSVLITNDERDIVFGPPRESGRSSRRQRLLRATHRMCPAGADILTSKQAHAKCPKQP